MADDSEIVRLVQVTKRYDSGDAAAVEVLSRIDLQLAAGASLAVVGPSGCGKSTLLNIIGALDRPSSGSVCVAGKDLSALTDDQAAQFRSQQVGFIFQDHHLLPQCTVIENVTLPTLAPWQKPQRDTAVAAAERLLERVGLAPRLDHRPAQLSGGERQRVAVVRALINRPRLLLADEPTGALDGESAERLAELLVELNREEGVALILVTHAPALAERMQRVCVLRNGRLVD